MADVSKDGAAAHQPKRTHIMDVTTAAAGGSEQSPMASSPPGECKLSLTDAARVGAGAQSRRNNRSAASSAEGATRQAEFRWPYHPASEG
jgi:hypothetical protein